MLGDLLGRVLGGAPKAPSAPCDRLFVYGTLMNLHALRDRWGVEPAKVEKADMRGDLYSAENQPIMLDGRGVVHGLVLRIPAMEAAPSIFDRYEGCRGNSADSFHLRVQRDAVKKSGEVVTAWVFLGNPAHRLVRRACVEENRIREGRWSASPNWLHGPLD